MAEKNAKERRAEKRARLQEFYEEIESQRTGGNALPQETVRTENTEAEKLSVTVREKSKEEKIFCPKCGRELESRKSECPRCGYKGYVPLSDAQSKKIRWILFAVLGVIAVAILIWRAL